MSSALRLGTYLLVGAIGLFELAVLWLMLNPDVPPDYRAYYVDQTTTCLNQPVSGRYAGGVVSFLPDGIDAARPLRVCGWEGPAGDGTHAVGTSSRLRFEKTALPANPALLLELTAVEKDGVPAQRVNVSLNGVDLGTIEVRPAAPETVTLPVPAAALQGDVLDMTLDFPDAMAMGPSDPPTRRRSIKLLRAGFVAG